ncbi:MAG TPA: hypothetical protein VGC64_00880, partial [Pyrinomonadaceae bacterium]
VTATGQRASVSETLNRLQAIKTDEFETRVPPAARPLLVQLKHQLRDLIADTLNAPAGRSAQRAALRARVLVKLGEMGIKVGDPPSDKNYQYTYGYIEDIGFQTPPRHPELLAVVTSLTVRCGEDSSLYLFRREGVRWRLLLADEANNYEDIGGAHGLFGYAISPPDHRGRFFVVTVNVNPWCNSNWQSIRYKVLRPGNSATQPRVIMSREGEIFLGVEPRYSLSVKENGFTLTFTGALNLDAGLFSRLYVENFMVDERSATRVAPVALRAEDFLDEWIQLPWNEAARWSAPGRRTELKRWHEKLQKLNYFSELLFIQPCHSRSEWQIGARVEEHSSSGSLSSKLFFNIARRRQRFTLRSVSTERPAGCPGETSPYGHQP